MDDPLKSFDSIERVSAYLDRYAQAEAEGDILLDVVPPSPADLREVLALARAAVVISDPPDPMGEGLRSLAARLTPNPARTVAGTLAIILDGIDRIPDETLARAIGHVQARDGGLDVGPLTDEMWQSADINVKLLLIKAAKAMKESLRRMSE
jgi:hypothetical protein